jgi:NAD(P)-dependent dehydrogenase (short-subunit alcohol dehydrogenase family)
MADALAAAGADVAIWGRNEERNAAAAARLSRHGTRTTAVCCDIADEARVEEAFAATVSGLGRIDACFANAAVVPPLIPFVEQTLEQWTTVLRVNVEGTFLTLRAAARHMIARGEGGSLVGVSSMAAIDGQARGGAYGPSKAGICATINALAVELARHGIRANTLVPAFARTPGTPFFDGPPFTTKVLPRIPMRRWGRPEDFGGIAVYLMSPASAYHTGDTFIIDGGYHRM